MSEKAIQNLVIYLRLLAYIGVNFNAIIVPILIFKFTGSVAIAGMALFFEWCPKLLFYLFGGSFISYFTAKKTHITIEIIRIITFLGFLLTILFLQHWIYVAICSAIYQATNAISNIINETMVNNHWKDDIKPIGYSKLLKADLEAAFIAMAIAFFVSNLIYLTSIAIFIQLFVCIFIFTNINKIHLMGEDQKMSFLENIFLIKKALILTDKNVFKLSALALLQGITGSLVFSTLTFYLTKAFHSNTIEADYFALFSMIKIIFCIFLIKLLTVIFSKKLITEKQAAFISFFTSITSLLIITYLDYFYAAIALITLGFSLYLYAPWHRTLRQSLLPDDLKLRYILTGILISIEAFCYILGAILLMIFNNLFIINWILIAINIICIFIFLTIKVYPKQHKQL